MRAPRQGRRAARPRGSASAGTSGIYVRHSLSVFGATLHEGAHGTGGEVRHPPPPRGFRGGPPRRIPFWRPPRPLARIFLPPPRRRPPRLGRGGRPLSSRRPLTARR